LRLDAGCWMLDKIKKMKKKDKKKRGIQKIQTSWIREESFFDFVCPYCKNRLYDSDFQGIIEYEKHFKGKVYCQHCRKAIYLTVDG
jgi:protein-disulfide isomerase